MEDAVAAQVEDEWAAPVVPESGLVFSAIKYMQLQLCKPKLLPIKSYSLEKLEKMEMKLAQEAKEKRDADRSQRHTAVGWTSPDLRKEPDPPAAAAAPPSSSSPLPSGSAKASPAPRTIDSNTPTSPLPLPKQDASLPSTSVRQLTEEEVAADALGSPQNDNSSDASASEVSALSRTSSVSD
ncbi:hypothetical protein ABB37_07089 [Leptomonas pyrrhocoris]|uniref:Uncharacterized protein n=1 Tax=Leptomonas pyrrhocoris TaxID=157538 RepID=A0A0N0DT91_LEPPY|nr:hypothetical protein ABB37_07089 [Leptomonas pyrrhocoris]KPA77168.1 hypothetical protein ABB37_07089 [Leptomonas pyrrhocoris]|eukprot:XP_015655607.1 hypothetical protein ABB37_07089 [Leptomonas pyrrhocoris]